MRAEENDEKLTVVSKEMNTKNIKDVKAENAKEVETRTVKR